MNDGWRRGLLFIASGFLLVLASFGMSWALAPEPTKITPKVDVNNSTTLVGVQGPGPNGNITTIDGHGNTIWSHGDGEVISYLDVSTLDNGTVLGTHTVEVDDGCGPYDPPCKRTGVRIIDPDTDEIVGEWDYPIKTRKDSEVHDAELLPSGELLVADMEYESVFVVDMTTDERRWTWNASEFYDEPDEPTDEDWLHINDVDRIDEGRYLVSVRNANQLLILEEGEGVVEVVNEDGDPDVLYEQHNPQWLGDGKVLVADSENNRVVELHRNDGGEWEVAWAVAEAGGIMFDWPRDADRLPNGHTLVTDSRNDRVVEIDADGDLVASWEVDSLPYEADRVPVGEAVGRVLDESGSVANDETRLGIPSPIDGNRSVVTDVETREHIPVLSTALASVRHTVAVPYWVSEIHLGVVLVSVALCGWGGRLLLG